MSRSSASFEKSREIQFHGDSFDVHQSIVSAEVDPDARRLQINIKDSGRILKRWVSLDLIQHAATAAPSHAPCEAAASIDETATALSGAMI